MIKALEIVDELSDQIFDILLRSGKKMSFLPGRAGSSNSAEVQDDGSTISAAEDALPNRATTTKANANLRTLRIIEIFRQLILFHSLRAN